ncbi:MAG: hypothetical protein QOK17_2258 [Sphingomonadales bacterium]|nr:hypothetical protein [Sphingomonadales bacterium]
MTSKAPQPASPASGRGDTPPILVGLKGLCPRCGAGTLFQGLAGFAPKCRACGLDYSDFNVGDGPAPFLIFIVGGLITGLAVALELSASPPFWVHVILWVPLAALLVVGLLRVAKGLLLALEYRHRAREGRIAPRQ